MTATYKCNLNLCICLHWKRRHPWQLLKCFDSREIHQPGSLGAGMLVCSNTRHRTDMESMHTAFRLHWCCSWTSWEAMYLLGVGWVFAHRLLLCAAAGVPDQHRLWLWIADKGPRWHTSVTNMSPVQCRTETRRCQNNQLNIAGQLPSSANILGIDQVFWHHADNPGSYMGWIHNRERRERGIAASRVSEASGWQDPALERIPCPTNSIICYWGFP